MTYRRGLLPCIVGLVFFLASGCSPSAFDVVLVGQSDLNRGGNAVVVHVFQLSGDTNFTGSPRRVFWRDAEETVREELVSHERVLLYPDQTESVNIQPEEGTKFIGIAADFREPHGDEWRKLYKLDEVNGQTVQVTVRSNDLQVTLK